MADWTQIGKLLLIAGIGLALLGGVLIVSAKFVHRDKLPWLGRLPGDIRIERRNFSCYFPLATGILVSLLLTVLLNIIARLFRR